MEVARGGGEDDVGESVQCSDHPYRSNPGGICAFCLQEKLGKLVSSSFPNAIFPSSSCSPSFRSEIGGVGGGGGGGGASSTSLTVRPPSASSSYSASRNCHYHGNYSRRARIPFLLAQKKKKKEVMGSDAVGIVLKRSKSTTAPRHGHFLVESEDADDYSPEKRGFWSFLHLSKSAVTRKIDKGVGSAVTPRESKLTAAIPRSHASLSHKPKDKGLGSSSLTKEEFVGESESSNGHATASSSSFGRKVSRSRSVGCGSRSFSGDFFERISTGFGDCTLRRVESQREGKPKSSGAHRAGASGGPEHHCIKERIKCGGIFGGFSMTSSSSPSSSSSYWMSSSVEDNVNGRSSAGAGVVAGPLSHGRSKSWGWAFASPMRALSKPSSSKVEYKDGGKRDVTPNKPNLAAIPSLMAVRG